MRYVGLIGSKAKVRRIFDVLLEEGMPPEALRPVHAPIGLDIGAITPQEIAVSIVAELIAVKHGKIAEPAVAAVSMRWEGALTEIGCVHTLIRNATILTMNDGMDVVVREPCPSATGGSRQSARARPAARRDDRRRRRLPAPGSSRLTSTSARRCSAATPTTCG